MRSYLTLSARLLVIALAASVALATAGARDDAKEPHHFGVPRSDYVARRAAAMSALGDGILVLRGTIEEEHGETKFHQNPWFFYLTGVDAPGAYLVLNPLAPEGSRSVIYLPPVDPTFERWIGPQTKPGTETARVYGFDDARETDRFESDVAAILESAEASKRLKIYSVVPHGEDARFSRDLALVETLQGLVPADRAKTWEIDDARYELGELRRKKSEAELAVLRRAIEITAEAQRDFARVTAPGRFEYEGEAAIIAAFLRNGAARAGFPSIVGSGPFSTVLHYSTNNRKMEAGDLVVVDIGAEYNYYTADITRTWPVSGRFTPRQREVYSLVLGAQQAAERAYRPGMSMRDLHRAAAEHMRASALRDSRGETLDRAFLHGLGHFLGLEVHDVGDPTKPLQPGDVITIEPGIYLPDEKLGVRIEDDYLVTEKGLVKLSSALPSDPDGIERMMRDR